MQVQIYHLLYLITIPNINNWDIRSYNAFVSTKSDTSARYYTIRLCLKKKYKQNIIFIHADLSVCMF